MRFGYLAAVLALTAGTAAVAQQGSDGAVDYNLTFPYPERHEATISATFNHVPPGPFEVRMARSSPGRYALHEFAKNVYAVSATDAAGRPLPIRRTDPYSWVVGQDGGTVRFTYTLFGDLGDGTYAQVNRGHVHLNIPATLAYAPTLADRPATVTIVPPSADWSVATQLIPDGPNRWRARDLQYLMDSPIEVAPLHVRQWAASEPGGNYTIRLMIHSADKAATVDRYAAMAEKVYRAHVAMWGDIPNYDGGTYTFLADYVPYATGDGMEHRNSTYLVDERSLSDANYDQIGTFSHEIFHSWNVERLRPAELEPFDFERANPTPSLWVAEGFTSYYGPLMIRRAGVDNVDAFLREMTDIYNSVIPSTGRRYDSPAGMSLRAPFADAATSTDPINFHTFTSYYPYGAAIALALDLTLRQRGQTTLDDMMRGLWRSHGAPEKPYRLDDVQAALATVSNDPAFARDFFERSIEGSALPDLTPLLAQAGVSLRPRTPGKAFVGRTAMVMDKGAVVLKSYPEPGSALYEAGLTKGDQIVRVDGRAIASLDQWTAVVARMKPGRVVRIDYRNLGKALSATLRPSSDPRVDLVRDETLGKKPTAAQLAFRNAWLGDDGTMMPPAPKKKP